MSINPTHDLYCPQCGEQATVERLPAGSIHFARAACPGCERFLRWVPAPMTADRADRMALPFGKHKGEAFGALALADPDYLRWVIHKSDLKPTFKQAARVVLGIVAPQEATP